MVVVGAKSDDIWVARYRRDGTLDPEFGQGGEVTTVLGGGEVARAVAVQPNGQIVVVGWKDRDFAVLRYLPHGDPDRSFDGNGQVITDFNGAADAAYAVAVQPDGKVVVVGYSYDDDDSDFALARYTTTGALDPSFDGNGLRFVGFREDEQAYRVLLQADGKLVVMGQSDFSQAAIARLHPDGRLDSTFSGDGLVLSSAIGYGIDGLVQPDGKIVVVCHRAKMARFLPDGRLDATFDLDGVTGLQLPPGPLYPSRVLRQPDGSLLVAGPIGAYPYDLVGLARYTSSGTLDFRFADGRGYVTLNLPGPESSVTDMALGPEGQIVLLHKGGGRYHLTRFFPDGTPATGGRVLANPLLDESETLADVAILPSGRIVAVGTSRTGTDQDLLLARFTPAGRLTDKVVEFTDGTSTGQALAVDAQGRFLVAGRYRPFTSTDYDVRLWRYLPDGTPDRTFGLNTSDFYAQVDWLSPSDEAHDLLVQPDGKIIVVGTSNGNLAIARFLPDGQGLDASFNGTGKVVQDINRGTESLEAAVLQPDGKLVVAGWRLDSTGTYTQMLVARYLPNGRMDPTFGPGLGYALGPAPATDNGTAYAVALLPDGRILLAGVGGGQFLAVRFLAIGYVDTAFGTGGMARSNFFQQYAIAYDMAVEPDGTILLAGTSASQVAVARFTAAGQIDQRFSNDGHATFDLSDGFDSASAMARDRRNGEYVLVGRAATNYGRDTQMALVRIKGQAALAARSADHPTIDEP
jgi:uncharacterized delta-60 repeat protein